MVVQFLDHDIGASTEMPVRISGARASQRNPYTTCLGCNCLVEIPDQFERTREHNWHEDCFRDHNEQFYPEVEDTLDIPSQDRIAPIRETKRK
ncbi:hypothetical protein FA15DRAFT_629005 [Coprinopsis marcescibilis]|uniref:Uncharacterized protein n=1 Tax=Coprinopsis marcescibilis TaxID=230819 RepID=A0A5C3KBW9_COPMA|nr:hypothetical protein FA15DRAFT_629005 [Coprinopsis marcescibilis]